jgi:hypothetical protein
VSVAQVVITSVVDAARRVLTLSDVTPELPGANPSNFVTMTEQQPVLPNLAAWPRRVGWFVIACSAASLALTATDWLRGGAVRWTAWMLPILIAANAGVFFLHGLSRQPRLARGFVILSLALAAAIISSETLVLLHR